MEITNLVVGPVGNVPLDYIYDFNDPKHREEIRADYANGISSLLVSICEEVSNYPDKVIVDISDLSVVNNPEEDEYATVIPKVEIFPDLAAITMFFHKSINEKIYDTVLEHVNKESPGSKITDFDVLTTCVCLNDSKISNFGITTQYGTYQIDCVQVDDVVFQMTDGNGRKGKFSMRIVGIPDNKKPNGEYDNIATIMTAMSTETTREMFKTMSNFKLTLSLDALSYVMMTSGPRPNLSHNCLDVIYFRSVAKQCIDQLVLEAKGNSIN